jgi:hypothetical protein
MKERWLTTTMVMALVVGPSRTAGAADAPAGWDALRALVGEWEGTYDGKSPARISYRLVSNGTALMETMTGEDSSDMVSLYHPDGASVVMTHYCSMGNQPRMRARAGKDGALEFAYIDATNVKSPAEHVMSRLVMTFPDRDHLVQEWTSKTGSKEETGRFIFTRRK